MVEWVFLLNSSVNIAVQKIYTQCTQAICQIAASVCIPKSLDYQR